LRSWLKQRSIYRVGIKPLLRESLRPKEYYAQLRLDIFKIVFEAVTNLRRAAMGLKSSLSKFSFPSLPLAARVALDAAPKPCDSSPSAPPAPASTWARYAPSSMPSSVHSSGAASPSHMPLGSATPSLDLNSLPEGHPRHGSGAVCPASPPNSVDAEDVFGTPRSFATAVSHLPQTEGELDGIDGAALEAVVAEAEDLRARADTTLRLAIKKGARERQKGCCDEGVRGNIVVLAAMVLVVELFLLFVAAVDLAAALLQVASGAGAAAARHVPLASRLLPFPAFKRQGSGWWT
jgi:hypothetical protein